MPVARELRRLPIDSPQPILLFALSRVVLASVALATFTVLGFPIEGGYALYMLLVVLPWTSAVLYLAYRNPAIVLSLATAAIDFAVLIGVELFYPDAYAAIRFVALFLIAVHADLQGERRGVAIAVLGSVPLATIALVDQSGQVTGELLAFWEVLFVATAVATGLAVGRLRTAASESHLRARMLSRRTLEGEREVRRRVAESIHDGPVQELIALDMMLAAARQAAESGDARRADELIGEARLVAMRNVRSLRDEIVDLGPYAFEELSYAQALDNYRPLWERRYGIQVLLSLGEVEMSPELSGDLFRITQEAVVNAGRHAHAESVSVSLRSVDGWVELRVADDGRGFANPNSASAGAPGHLGLAAMRERAELLDGDLEIDTGDRGTRVVVRVPLARRGAPPHRRR
jgi:two-component system NarL family sensor kinase